MAFSLSAGTFMAGARLASLGFNLYTHLSTKANNASGHKKLILRELRNNIKLLEMRDVDKVNSANLIRGLSNLEIVAALRDNYNLNKLTKKSKVVHPEMIFRDYDKKYVNWHMKEIMEKIDERIQNLHQIVNSFDNIHESPYNLTAKLNNLFYLCLIAALMTKTK